MPARYFMHYHSDTCCSATSASSRRSLQWCQWDPAINRSWLNKPPIRSRPALTRPNTYNSDAAIWSDWHHHGNELAIGSQRFNSWRFFICSWRHWCQLLLLDWHVQSVHDRFFPNTQQLVWYTTDRFDRTDSRPTYVDWLDQAESTERSAPGRLHDAGQY